jgi:hypothetical protein
VYESLCLLSSTLNQLTDFQETWYAITSYSNVVLSNVMQSLITCRKRDLTRRQCHLPQDPEVMYGNSLDDEKLCSFCYGNVFVQCKKQQYDNGSKIVYSIQVGREN